MPTPKAGYRLADGTQVPGVTTIIGRFKESGALIQWAYKRGKEGLDLYESRDRAGEIGTAVHDMVEQFCRGENPYHSLDFLTDEKDKAQARGAFSAFQEWYEAQSFFVLAQELQLVSEAYRFGGTPDAIARDGKGRIVLLDWKTSASVYSDHLIQLAAYRLLWNETHPEMQLTGGSHLCRFAKEHGDFAHHYFPNLDEAERAFVLMRELYPIDQALKKRAA